MDINFEVCLDLVMVDFEPPGFGFSQSEYDAWRSLLRQPRADIATMPRPDLVAMFRQQYWVPECPVLPIGTDYLFFDMKVKLGSYMATKLLQVALGKGVDGEDIPPDGHFGLITMAAAMKADPRSVNDKLPLIKRQLPANTAPPNLKAQAVYDRALLMLGVKP
jgi:lysozyme family protein